MRNHSFVIASSRFNNTLATAVHAARSSILTPLGKAKGLSGSLVARFHGFNSPAAKRSLCLFNNPINSADYGAVGFLASAMRKANSSPDASAPPPSLTVFSANARAASRKTVSLSVVRACIGVFDLARRTQEKSPFGASKACSAGYGVER